MFHAKTLALNYVSKSQRTDILSVRFECVGNSIGGGLPKLMNVIVTRYKGEETIGSGTWSFMRR